MIPTQDALDIAIATVGDVRVHQPHMQPAERAYLGQVVDELKRMRDAASQGSAIQVIHAAAEVPNNQ